MGADSNCFKEASFTIVQSNIMGTVKNRELSCRLCLRSKNQDEERYIQITDEKGKSLHDNQSSFRINSLLNIMVEFPDEFDCCEVEGGSSSSVVSAESSPDFFLRLRALGL